MTTLAELRTKARNFIKDTSDNPKVSDEELTDYASYALADYSQYFPRHVVAELEAAAFFAMPEDMLPEHKFLRGVEVDGEMWALYELRPKEKLPTSGNIYYWRGDEIKLATTPASAVYLHYDGLHTVPAEGEDLTVPLANQELLVIYMAAKFHQKMGTVAAKLDRFKETGRRDDNPLVFMHELLMRDYQTKIAERLPKGTVTMRSR